MTTKDRKLLQSIGEKFREIDPDIWIKKAFEISRGIDKCVIADLRRENEYFYAVENGFTPIRVHADLYSRIKRSIERDGVQPDISTWDNQSEIGADHLEYRYEIYNDVEFNELYDQLDHIMKEQ